MLAAALRLVPGTALALLLAVAPAGAAPDALPAPTGEVLLTVGGDIARTNGDGIARFDDAMLATLPQVSFTTSTIWTKDRVITFTGPTLSAILEAVGAEAGTVRARAVNDYVVEFATGEIGSEAPVVARLIDGARFGLRENGPLWVVYPYDAAPEYRSELVYARSIWQLVELTVEAE
jgi:hypothetical protein